MKTYWKKIKDNIYKLNKYRNHEEINNNLTGKNHEKTGQQFDKAHLYRKNQNFETDKTRFKILYISLFIWFFTISFYFVLFSGISKIISGVENKINLKTEDSFSVFKPGIEILNSLKNRENLNFIQRIYVHPKDENKIIIMIKPNYWGTLSPLKKEKIKSKVLEKWKKIYRNSNPGQNLKPEACFANT